MGRTRPETLAALAACALLAALALAAGGPSSLAFDGGFETGSYRPWAPQAANYGHADNAQVHFGTFAVTRRKAGQGRFGGRFSLPAWSGGRTRSQLITRRTVNAGGDDYYSLMFYLPPRWSPGTTQFWGVSIAELNYQGLGAGSPTVALQAHPDHVTVAVGSGRTSSSFPFDQYRSNADSTGTPNLPPLYAVPRPMKLGVWHELVIHCHWATDQSGSIQVWHRLKGQARWKLTASLTGYPTLQTWPDGTYPSNTIDILQAYRGPSTKPVVVWLDGFSRAQSFALAAANVP